MRIYIDSLAPILVALGTQISTAETITLRPVADTTLFPLSGGSNNFGGADTFVVGTTAHRDIGRAAIRFEFVDLEAASMPLRFYRALIRPEAGLSF